MQRFFGKEAKTGKTDADENSDAWQVEREREREGENAKRNAITLRIGEIAR